MLSDAPARVAGSYRDRAGFVAEWQGNVYRIVSATDAERARSVLDQPVVRRLMSDGWLVRTSPVSDAGARAALGVPEGGEALLHERVQRISYSYEWPFALLKSAALHHLDLHLQLLEGSLTLADATAYNVQFVGTRPVFIDFLSIRPYRDGEMWAGQRQFVEQFLAPLVLASDLDIAPQAWLRGSPEGIPIGEFSRLLSIRRKVTPTFLLQVVLPARMQASLVGKDARQLRPRPLSKQGFVALLSQLRSVIEGLRTPGRTKSTWADYEGDNSYLSEEEAAKRALIDRFCRGSRGSLIDLGCNAGAYSKIALEAGAASVVGVDGDLQALDVAYDRAVAGNWDFLPLVQDLASPTPAQGWRGNERSSFAERMASDNVLALALIHHLMIGRNLPVDQVIGFITGMGRSGVIEFVSKDDVQVQRLLAHRDDIFSDYDEESVLAAIRSRAKVSHVEKLGSGTRSLILFESA